MSLTDSPLVVYDIGARGRLQDAWHEIAARQDPNFRFVLFEPDPQGAADLRKVYEGNAVVDVIEQAALHKKGRFPLHIARHSTCSSILQSNSSELARYNIGPIFENMGQIEVECDRLENVAAERSLLRPDFVKIDVQGVEYLVLQGMGDMLSTCLGIELETHLYPVYKNQRLLGDIVGMLADFGLRLCDLTPQRHFDYEYVEANAIFCREEATLTEPHAAEKMQIIRTACNIWFHPQGQSIRASLNLP